MDNELTHHGILGQKWGIRRFQPYPSGHKGGKEVGDAARKDSNGDAITRPIRNKIEIIKKKRDSKYRSTLSDEDLKKKIDRLKMEKELRELTEKEISPGRSFVREVMRESGKRVATTALTGTGLFVAKRFVGGVFDSTEFADAVFNGGPKKKK